MDTYETLIEKANRDGLEVVDYSFRNERLKGLYCNGIAAISNKLVTSTEKTCILAEELGHFHTSYGNILNQSNISNCKQEHQARVWAYHDTAGLYRIIEALNGHCSSLIEMADFLEVTEEFLIDALAYYKSKYGLYATVGNYTIFFEPLCVLELYK